MAKGSFITEVVIPQTKEFEAEINKHLGSLSQWNLSVEKDGYHLKSMLPEKNDMNEHLIWLFMSLDHHRSLFRSMTQNGVEITCKCKWNKKRPVKLEAKALSMAHLLGINLEIN